MFRRFAKRFEDGKAARGEALWEASRYGKLTDVERLLSQRAPIEWKSEYDETPLHAAANNNHINVVEKLLSSGAQVDALNRWGSTPLISAARFGHLEIIKRLITAGANHDHKNNAGDSALSKAKSSKLVAKENRQEIVDYLSGLQQKPRT